MMSEDDVREWLRQYGQQKPQLSGYVEMIGRGRKPMNRLRWWLIKVLAGSRGVVLNVKIEGTLVVTGDESVICDNTKFMLVRRENAQWK